MRVLGIGGSPRIGGNSDILLDRALEGAAGRGAVTEKIVLDSLAVAPCREGDYAPRGGACEAEDDFPGVYRKVRNAGAVVLASPIFFGSLSAQAKAMIDRFQCAWLAKHRDGKSFAGRKRPGAFISVEASERRDFFENARAIVRNWFAVVDLSYSGELFVTGVEEKGDVLKRPDALEAAFNLGAGLVTRDS